MTIQNTKKGYYIFIHERISQLYLLTWIQIQILQIQHNIQLKMKKAILATLLTVSLHAQNLRDTQTCNYVGDNCPVWNGWSPKCHVSAPICNGQNCYVQACTYSAARAFGTSTDLLAGVNGVIQRIAAHDSYNCAGPEILNGGATFKVHCGCGGGCSFHGNYDVWYISRGSAEQRTGISSTSAQTQIPNIE